MKGLVKVHFISGLTDIGIPHFQQKQLVITSPGTLPWWRVWWRSVEDCDL